MLIFIKFISSIILSLGGALAIANIENTKIKIGKRQIIYILTLSFATYFFTKVEFSIVQSTSIFIVMILAYKEVFEFELPKAIVMTAIIMLLVSIGDASGILLTIPFINKELYRTNYFWLLFCNVYIAFFLWAITKIKVLSYKINNFVNNISNNKVVYIILKLILVVLLIFLLTYKYYINFELNVDYIANLLMNLLVGIILFTYIQESNNYNKLLDEYDKIIEYVQTFEEWIEEEQLELHESKNSLSAIYEMTNIKEVRKEINKILNRKGTIEDKWVIDLKPVPKGGLKGLLYYKFMIAKNNKLNVISDVSNTVTNALKRLNKEESKLLLRLIGIYFDNAIEAATESKTKNISLEIYIIKKEINIVISNTYKEIPKLEDIGKKGCTTKGHNRGKGTYLAKKLVSKNSKFVVENKIINNYYIQKIVIK